MLILSHKIYIVFLVIAGKCVYFIFINNAHYLPKTIDICAKILYNFNK